jgi:hypothetical protein
MTVKEEALVVLTRHHPAPISTADLASQLTGGVQEASKTMLGALEGNARPQGRGRSLVLTEPGLRTAIEVSQKHATG